MPMIRGRYYMNPAVGHALEEARAIFEQKSQGNDDNSSDLPDRDERGRFRGKSSRTRFVSSSTDESSQNAANDRDSNDVGDGAVHHVEIECAEIGRNGGGKQRGFVAHVHREIVTAPQHDAVDGPDGFVSEDTNESGVGRFAGPVNRPGMLPSGVFPPRATAHVFTNANDLADFLREILGQDSD